MSSSSVGGVGGPAGTCCEREVLMKRFWPPKSWARSPMVQGGGVSGLRWECVGVGGIEVGEQFIMARSASWSASEGEGASKEKSRKRAAMAGGGGVLGVLGALQCWVCCCSVGCIAVLGVLGVLAMLLGCWAVVLVVHYLSVLVERGSKGAAAVEELCVPVVERSARCPATQYSRVRAAVVIKASCTAAKGPGALPLVWSLNGLTGGRLIGPATQLGPLKTTGLARRGAPAFHRPLYAFARTTGRSRRWRPLDTTGDHWAPLGTTGARGDDGRWQCCMPALLQGCACSSRPPGHRVRGEGSLKRERLR